MRGLVLALAAGASSAAAQTLTPEELRALVDERVAALSPYEELLADSDPQRSMAAMEIMLESGDPDLQRMALDHGLYSPNPRVRESAVTAFLQTEPVLQIVLDGSGIEDVDYGRYVRTNGGSISADGTGTLSLRIGPFDAEAACFPYVVGKCALRINGNAILVRLSGYWSPAVLGDDGVLRGEANLAKVDTPVPYSIAIGD